MLFQELLEDQLVTRVVLTLELPYTYATYPEFVKEFTAILSSDEGWLMAQMGLILLLNVSIRIYQLKRMA